MNQLIAYGELGFRHIADLAALDHIVFLLALAAPYRAADWRSLAVLATAFTVGHSITLALAVSETVALPPAVIEFLIPVTIVITAFRNLREGRTARRRLEPWLAGGFGLIHGAGFANYLTALFDGPIGVPLLGFNLGVEVGQILILGVVLAAFEAIGRVPQIDVARRVLVSAGAGVWAVTLAFDRLPW